MATSNRHKSETTSSIITTEQGVGMGSVAFSDVLLLESLSMEREAQKVTEMVRFSQKNCGDYIVMFRQVPAGI